MKYAVAQCVNGNFSIVSEWSEKNKAFENYHTACTNLWHAEDVEHATVTVIDERFSIHKIEYIKYEEQAS